jgi:colicin import membrane protein
MKAALEAWGADSNLFHQGVAKESNDPDVVAATMSKPGVILRHPVRSHGSFSEHADLPTHRSSDEPNNRPKKARAKSSNQPRRAVDDNAARKASLAFEKEQRRRESERRKEEAARQRERERRQLATAKAQAALEKAKREHDRRAATIETERAALEKRSEAEDTRWEKQKEKLETALRRERDQEKRTEAISLIVVPLMKCSRRRTAQRDVCPSMSASRFDHFADFDRRGKDDVRPVPLMSLTFLVGPEKSSGAITAAALSRNIFHNEGYANR